MRLVSFDSGPEVKGFRKTTSQLSFEDPNFEFLTAARSLVLFPTICVTFMKWLLKVRENLDVIFINDHNINFFMFFIRFWGL